MNKFKIWKIQSLWEKYYDNELEQKNPKDFSALLKNYKNGVSKFHSDFYLKKEFNFKKSTKPVFVGENRESGELKKVMNEEPNTLKKFFGLREQQLILKNNKPIYLVDNHNKALFAFLEISQNFKDKINIIHIDAHRDNAIFQKIQPFEKLDFENIKWYLKNSQVSDYLDLGKKSGLIKKVWSVTQSTEFKTFKIPKKKFILNLDIDIFGPEGEAVDLELKIKTIALVWKKAEAVIIATSPGYIKSSEAESIIRTFLK